MEELPQPAPEYAHSEDSGTSPQSPPPGSKALPRLPVQFTDFLTHLKTLDSGVLEGASRQITIETYDEYLEVLTLFRLEMNGQGKN